MVHIPWEKLPHTEGEWMTAGAIFLLFAVCAALITIIIYTAIANHIRHRGMKMSKPLPPTQQAYKESRRGRRLQVRGMIEDKIIDDINALVWTKNITKEEGDYWFNRLANMANMPGLKDLPKRPAKQISERLLSGQYNTKAPIPEPPKEEAPAKKSNVVTFRKKATA